MKYYSKEKKFYKFNIKEELKTIRIRKTFEVYANDATSANNFLTFRPQCAIWFYTIKHFL